MLLLGLPPQRRAGANGMEEGEGYGVSIGKGWRFGGVSKTFFARYHPGSLPETGGSVKHFHKYLLKTSCVCVGGSVLDMGGLHLHEARVLVVVGPFPRKP